jgi:hypothetical protein
MKLYIYITDVDQALKDDFDWCLTATTISNMDETTNWIWAATVDVKLSVDRQKLIKHAVKALTNKENELLARLHLLANKKQEYLSLPHLEEE